MEFLDGPMSLIYSRQADEGAAQGYLRSVLLDDKNFQKSIDFEEASQLLLCHLTREPSHKKLDATGLLL